MKLSTAQFPLRFCSAPTATITSTNIHLCYDVFLMEHINCICCCLACYNSLLFSFYYYCYYFILFLYIFSFSGNAVLQYKQTCTRLQLFYCITGTVIVCDFVCNLMAFVP